MFCAVFQKQSRRGKAKTAQRIHPDDPDETSLDGTDEATLENPLDSNTEEVSIETITFGIKINNE